MKLKIFALLSCLWMICSAASVAQFSGSFGNLPPGMSLAGAKRYGFLVAPTNGGTALTGVGMGNPTTTGTLTNAVGTDGAWVNVVTAAATTGTDYGWSYAGGGSAFARIDGNPDVTFSFRTGANAADIQSSRLWIGLASNGVTIFGQDTPGVTGAAHAAAFRYNPGVDGTLFFRCVTSNGSADTVTTTTQSIAANTAYLGRILVTSGTDVKFWINGNLVATNTATLPGSTQGCTIIAGGETTANATKNFQLRKIYIESF